MQIGYTPSPPLPMDNFEHWVAASWQTDRRYYQADISQDLFGMWVLRRSWGGLGNSRGNSKTHAFAKYEDALKFFESLAKQRLHRGYFRVA